MDQAETLTRLAVFGSPVKQSLSPRIHQLFATQAGLSVEYTAVEVSEDFLSREIQKLADAGGTGCNITMPLKRQAFKLANRASERAEIAGAANTLIFNSRTRWTADSTDGPGLVRDLLENLSIALHNRRICIIGAGGAAAGILYDLLLHKPAVLTLFNRTVGKAERLANRFARRFPDKVEITAASIEAMGEMGTFDLVINASSAGHFRQTPAISAELFGPGSQCYDLSYGNAHQVLGKWCSGKGIRCHDGLGMLVEQAAESFYLWTGFRPDTTPVLESLRLETLRG